MNELRERERKPASQLIANYQLAITIIAISRIYIEDMQNTWSVVDVSFSCLIGAQQEK